MKSQDFQVLLCTILKVYTRLTSWSNNSSSCILHLPEYKNWIHDIVKDEPKTLVLTKVQETKQSS